MARGRDRSSSEAQPDTLFAHVARSIHEGGSETFFSPPFLACGSDTHEPFRLMDHPVPVPDENGEGAPSEALWGVVSTSSWHFDGDRTDLHDVWSLCWAAFLRAAGIASPWLIDEEGWCGPAELSARHLIIQPHSWPLQNDGAFSRARVSLNAWTAFAFHMLDSVFDWQQAGRRPVGFVPYDDAKPAANWVEPVLRSLRHPKDYTTSKRIGPNWIYLSTLPRGISIVRLPRIRIRALKDVLASYHPSIVPGEHAAAVYANGIANGVPLKTIKLAKRLMERTGDSCDTPLILPIDSHCIFIGDKTLISIRENCGREIYEAEREVFLKPRASEDRVFFADSRIDWLSPLNAGGFEDWCVDLLRREPGVLRAKPVGGVNDRDSGRDILMDWAIPKSHAVPGKRQSRRTHILAQVKSRKRPVGKGDVQDIRDTLERHDAKGFLLIAHPRVSAPLVDHLEDLRDRTDLLVDWWEMRDLESRLRRHPDLAGRYPKLVMLRVADGA